MKALLEIGKLSPVFPKQNRKITEVFKVFIWKFRGNNDTRLNFKLAPAVKLKVNSV